MGTRFESVKTELKANMLEGHLSWRRSIFLGVYRNEVK